MITLNSSRKEYSIPDCYLGLDNLCHYGRLIERRYSKTVHGYLVHMSIKGR
jgi:hypothetical protein